MPREKDGRMVVLDSLRPLYRLIRLDGVKCE